MASGGPAQCYTGLPVTIMYIKSKKGGYCAAPNKVNKGEEQTVNALNFASS